MMTLPDFEKKQIIYVFLIIGEKISFKNDNLIVTAVDGSIRLQVTCYRIYMLCIVGSFTITTGLIQRSHKFGFPIFLLAAGFKVYDKLGAKMEGNVLLRKLQYKYSGLELAIAIINNKVINQLSILENRRNKSEELIHDIEKIKEKEKSLKTFDKTLQELLSIEGNVAKLYFKHQFDNVDWKGRKPRIKNDFINSTLDIGYSILFNFIETLLDIYGFDTYCGVLHKEFYMRKSLVCDLVEPFRVIIDFQVRKSINLGQFKEDDFYEVNGAYLLKWTANKKYISILTGALLERKSEIFLYIQSYYRAFMKSKPSSEFPIFSWEK